MGTGKPLVHLKLAIKLPALDLLIVGAFVGPWRLFDLVTTGETFNYPSAAGREHILLQKEVSLLDLSQQCREVRLTYLFCISGGYGHLSLSSLGIMASVASIEARSLEIWGLENYRNSCSKGDGSHTGLAVDGTDCEC